MQAMRQRTACINDTISRHSKPQQACRGAIFYECFMSFFRVLMISTVRPCCWRLGSSAPGARKMTALDQPSQKQG
jgi:hypothetical protein